MYVFLCRCRDFEYYLLNDWSVVGLKKCGLSFVGREGRIILSFWDVEFYFKKSDVDRIVFVEV